MTSDTIQNKHAARAEASLSGGLHERLELTRNQSFLDGRRDIFDLLARGPEEPAAAGGLDPLTGFADRQGLFAALRREIARTNRGYSDGGLLVIFTLENLCSIEEKQGKAAGEAALTLIAQALQSEIRDMDMAARTQEDEFVLLFADTRMGQALSRLQNMALRLNRLSLIRGGEEIRMSLSLGLKSYAPGAKAEMIFGSETARKEALGS
ncbi:MAG: diguanylate cyclase [Alphaproteobacteria bacterium]